MRFPRVLSVTTMLLAVALGGSASVLADQTDPALDKLFLALKMATDADAARPIEAEIWDIWLRSDDPRVNDLMARGIALLGAEDLDQALAAFDSIVTLAPKFAEGWNKRATTLYMMGRPEDSKRDIAQVLALEPRHFGALSGLGLCDAQLDQLPDALAAFQRAQAVDPYLPSIGDNIEELRKRLARESL